MKRRKSTGGAASFLQSLVDASSKVCAIGAGAGFAESVPARLRRQWGAAAVSCARDTSRQRWVGEGGWDDPDEAVRALWGPNKTPAACACITSDEELADRVAAVVYAAFIATRGALVAVDAFAVRGSVMKEVMMPSGSGIPGTTQYVALSKAGVAAIDPRLQKLLHLRIHVAETSASSNGCGIGDVGGGVDSDGVDNDSAEGGFLADEVLAFAECHVYLPAVVHDLLPISVHGVFGSTDDAYDAVAPARTLLQAVMRGQNDNHYGYEVTIRPHLTTFFCNYDDGRHMIVQTDTSDYVTCAQRLKALLSASIRPEVMRYTGIAAQDKFVHKESISIVLGLPLPTSGGPATSDAGTSDDAEERAAQWAAGEALLLACKRHPEGVHDGADGEERRQICEKALSPLSVPDSDVVHVTHPDAVVQAHCLSRVETV